MNWTMRAVVAVAVAVMTASACGDDDAAAPNTTAAAEETAQAYVARIESECPGEDPGFDAFLSDHPEPTAEDWAGFLSEPLEMVTTMSECISESDPPATLQSQIDDVVSAMDVVAADLESALASAKAGDLEETERWIAQMHDIDQPKIDEAVQAVMATASN
jgi:hypothetical protein